MITLSDLYPNLALANEYMPEDNQIFLMTDHKPYYRAGIAAQRVPRSLHVEDPEYIASELIKMISEADNQRKGGAQKAQHLAEVIESDLGYGTDVLESAVSVFVHSDKFYDLANPKIAFKGKITSVDRRYNLLTVPANCDLQKMYSTRIKKFIEESIK